MGDPRTRWRATGVFVGLIMADVAIGLTYMLLARGLAEDYSFWQRTVHEVSTAWSACPGRSSWSPETRGDLFNLLTSALGIFTLLVTAYLFLRPAEPRARPGRADAERIRELLGKQGDRDSLGYFALRRRQERDLVPHRQVLHLLPGGVRRDAGQRRPDRYLFRDMKPVR